MRLQEYSQRGAAVAGLCRAFAAGAPPHATLLTGPRGVGKRTLASLCCQSLFCVEVTGKPCGECPPCRRYLAGSHPDMRRIAEKKSIGVDEIRELTAELAEAPYEGGWKAVLIEHAGAMTAQAQNSLLKTLEEPPPRTAFVLTEVSASLLLTTVRSRCRIVPLPPMTDEQVETLLLREGTERAQAAQLAALAGGSIGEALRMREDTAFWALRDKVAQTMQAVNDPAGVPAALAALRDDKGDAQRICDLLESALRGALAAVTGVRALEDSEGWARNLRAMDARRLAYLLTAVGQMRKMLSSNVPWQAALERFLFEYAEER